MEELILSRLIYLINNDRSKDIGLFTGKSGWCLALYVYAFKRRDKKILAIAETIFREIISDLSSLENESFDKGVSGVASFINIVFDLGFISGDINNILYESDCRIYRYINKNIEQLKFNVTEGLLGYLMYYSIRLKNDGDGIQDSLNRSALRLLVDRLYNEAPRYLKSMHSDMLISVLGEVPIMIFVLRKIFDIGIYDHKIMSMFNEWKMYLLTISPFYNINKLLLVDSLLYINKRLNDSSLENRIRILIESIEFDEIKSEIDNRIFNINEGWPLAAFALYQMSILSGNNKIIRNRAEAVLETIKKSYFSDSLSRVNQKTDCSLINGLSGLLILCVMYPHVIS